MSISAEQEKTLAALNSVGAAVVLTGVKVWVGVATGSLGILAEAAHSAVDLLGAVVTFLAVRIAVRPADRDHNYGHGKFENLSALMETLLLFGTCGWIIYESISRLRSGGVHVQASFWAFAVMTLSIVVDISRSRMLARVASKHRSQALEADALHFSTDIWSSAVVILGLTCVSLAGRHPALPWLRQADAVAALLVAAIVILVSSRLGLRTVQALLDASPEGTPEKVKARVEAVDRVLDCHAIRVRHAGPQYFVDLHITLDGALPLREAHAVTERVEKAVEEILPGADVTVHPEPSAAPGSPAHPDHTRNPQPKTELRKGPSKG